VNRCGLPGAAANCRMSALGQKPTFAVQKGMSALPPKADMCGALGLLQPVAGIAACCGQTLCVDPVAQPDRASASKLRVAGSNWDSSTIRRHEVVGRWLGLWLSNDFAAI
jgi:hypothetical protein